jgi:hypothetical protein
MVTTHGCGIGLDLGSLGGLDPDSDFGSWENEKWRKRIIKICFFSILYWPMPVLY